MLYWTTIKHVELLYTVTEAEKKTMKDVLENIGPNFNMKVTTSYNEALKLICTVLENFIMFQFKPSLLSLVGFYFIFIFYFYDGW